MLKEEKSNIKIYLPLLITIGCLAMFWIETILQPGYLGKSIIKLGLFALLPLLYCRLAKPNIPLSF